jgi:hypothetical protein
VTAEADTGSGLPCIGPAAWRSRAPRTQGGGGELLSGGAAVAPRQDQQGSFPVDHNDARFALKLTKLFIAHTSHVLGR